MPAHTITDVRPFAPSGPGALGGNEAICSCGTAIRTSLSADAARRDGWAHADYMNRTPARVAR